MTTPADSDHNARINAFTAKYADSHAGAYTWTNRSGYFYLRRQELVARELERLPQSGGELLDVGCGAGHASAVAGANNFAYYGVDISPEMIEVAKTSRFNPKAIFALASVEDLPFASDRFDVVLALGSLEYVRADRQSAALAEISRVLKPGGIFVASLLNQSCPMWVARTLRERVGLVRAKMLRRPAPFVSPEHLYTRREVRARLEQSGLRHERTIGYSFALLPNRVYSRSPMIWSRLLSPIERRGDSSLGLLGMAHLIVARKGVASRKSDADPSGPPAWVD